MAEVIKVSKQDIIWGYFAQLFSITSGIILLPMILKKLSAEEVGMNYLMLSVAQFISLIDFGFSPQFGRNITYIYSGAQRLLKNGIDKLELSEQHSINYQLLATLIQTVRWVYQLIAGLVLFFMLTGGTVYIYHITKGFSNISNSLWIWMIYSFGVFFQIYYSYYSALLTGSGKIKESKKVMVYSYIAKILLTYLLLFHGYGLLGVVIVNFLYPFLMRYLSYHYYFTPELKRELSFYKALFSEKLILFNILWYNSKKQGLVAVISYFVYGIPMFLAGIYLSLEEVASYGLMVQLIGMVSGISGILFTVYQPRFASLRISDDINLLRKETAYTMCVFYLFYVLGTILLVTIAPWLIRFIGSQTLLPKAAIILVWAFFRLLDFNFWNLCQIVIAGNNFPFLRSCLYTGLGIAIGCYISLSMLHLKIWGIVLVTGLTQSAYNNWYWPHTILQQLNTRFLSFLKEGYKELYIRLLNK